MGIKRRGRLGTSRDSNPAGLCCSSGHLVQCEPDEASSFTNPNVGPGRYAGCIAWTRQQGLGFKKVRVDLCYLSMRPTNARIWHKAVFKVGRVARLKPTRVRQDQKYLAIPSAFPFLGRLAINLPPHPEGSKKHRGWPPWCRRKSPVPRHSRQNRPEVRWSTECNPTTGEERTQTA